MRVARLALGCVGEDSVAGITERGCDIHPRRVGQLAARQGGSNVPVIAYGRGVLTVLMLLRFCGSAGRTDAMRLWWLKLSAQKGRSRKIQPETQPNVRNFGRTLAAQREVAAVLFSVERWGIVVGDTHSALGIGTCSMTNWRGQDSPATFVEHLN